MNIVIDAEIINWYRTELAGGTPPATRPASDVIDRLGRADVAFVDDGGQIEQEWRSATDPDWFDQWFGDQLQTGAVVSVPVKRAADILKHVRVNCGFPRSKDVWYISTAKTLNDQLGSPSVIVTEDLDFYDPRLKACTAGKRQKVPASCSGAVARYLDKKHAILVRSIGVHCAP